MQNDFGNRVFRGNRVEFRLRFATADASYDGLHLSTAKWPSTLQRPDLVIAFEYP